MARRALPALLLAVALAGGAAAQPLPKPPPESPLASLPGPACRVEQRRAIELGLTEARPRVEAAIRFLDANPEHPHLLRWFGPTPAPRIRAGLQRIAAQLASGLQGLKLACNDAAECRGDAFAYTVTAVRLLGVCPGFFRAGQAGTDTRWGVLLHEAAHLSGVAGDHAYGVNGALALAKRSPRQAARNADNYEYFVETLPR